MQQAWLALALWAGWEAAGPPAAVEVHTFQFSQPSLAVAVGLASSPLVHRARAIHVSRISRSEWNRFDSPCTPQAGARIGEADSAA